MTRSKDVDPTGQFERAQEEVAGISHEAIPPKLDSIEPEASGPKAIAEFGHGRLLVDTGTLYQRPAVFVRPTDRPGPIGKLAPEHEQRKGPVETLQPGEFVITFPTMEQAERVADALVNVPSPAPVAVPAGYRLVPEEPTEEILDAFWYQTGESEEMRSRTHDRARRYWLAMLSASPVPSTATQAGAVTGAGDETDGGAE